MNNQQNGHVILWLTQRKYETMYRLLTCSKLSPNFIFALSLNFCNFYIIVLPFKTDLGPNNIGMDQILLVCYEFWFLTHVQNVLIQSKIQDL